MGLWMRHPAAQKSGRLDRRLVLVCFFFRTPVPGGERRDYKKLLPWFRLPITMLTRMGVIRLFLIPGRMFSRFGRLYIRHDDDLRLMIL